ncbi:hypothetical protein AXF42_Ash014404 [Apostasia shenzhenica]|uniref:Ubiquitin fusion degradation protein 1 like n=1 Tax=Apostasia shenzhenica TaxID=1088818 RepID=A0A2I0B113_9ASPA|nr:hypothetical protein AXF42_Ash014404 [Apostasia shenzhenica]
MDFELRVAREKLEREQRERRERAKAKAERERKAKAEAARRREAVEAAQQARRIEAENARLMEEQQMEEALVIGNGIVFSQVLEAIKCNGYGDKIKLPPSCFTELSDKGALDKGPMYFRLSRIDQAASVKSDFSMEQEFGMTHSGVLEFTSREGFVELPPHVWNNLFSHDVVDVPLIEVRYVSIPKGTYAKLKPEGIGFSDIPNHKAVLETALRKHATLSQGEVILVSHGELGYKLRVLELKPASSVSVLETDIEVDIEVSDSVLDDNQNQHVLMPLVFGKVESGRVGEGNFNFYKFTIDENMSEEVAAGCMKIEVKIEADTSNGDADIYVSRHPLVFPTQHRHEWSSHEMGSKTLILRPKDRVAGIYSVGVYGYKGQARYHISVSLKEYSNQGVCENAGTSSQVDDDSVDCQNCKHRISTRTILLHEAYCVRHNVICQYDGCGVVLRKEEAGNHVHCRRCGKAFQNGEMEKHVKIFHEPTACTCGVILEREEMSQGLVGFPDPIARIHKALVDVRHQSTSCPLRLIACRFCGDMVPAGNAAPDARDRLRGFSEHESICGSRTAPCDSCGRAVMLKEMDIHVIAVHQKS